MAFLTSLESIKHAYIHTNLREPWQDGLPCMVVSGLILAHFCKAKLRSAEEDRFRGGLI